MISVPFHIVSEMFLRLPLFAVPGGFRGFVKAREHLSFLRIQLPHAEENRLPFSVRTLKHCTSRFKHAKQGLSNLSGGKCPSGTEGIGDPSGKSAHIFKAFVKTGKNVLLPSA